MTHNILFHGIGAPARELEPGEDRFWVTVDSYHRILDEVATWPSVRLSFDDSNESDLTYALPALVERGLTADFFVIAGRLGHRGSLDPDAVRELVRAGMPVGSHGLTHTPWRRLSDSAIHDEFVRARDQIADVVGRPVRMAACPLGAYDRRTLSALRKAGYARVFTSDRRVARPQAWLQPRYSVRDTDTPQSLRAEVLARPPLPRRVRDVAAGVVKRWR